MERNSMRAVLLVVFCWFLLFAVPSTASFWGFKRQEGAVLNHVSKRRVPNGPDPIHNRRTRNTGQPPNRS